MITENEEEAIIWRVQVTELKISVLMLKLYCLNFTQTLKTETFISKKPYVFIRTGLDHISRSVKILSLSLPHWQRQWPSNFFSVPAQTILSIPGEWWRSLKELVVISCLLQEGLVSLLPSFAFCFQAPSHWHAHKGQDLNHTTHHHYGGVCKLGSH